MPTKSGCKDSFRKRVGRWLLAPFRSLATVTTRVEIRDRVVLRENGKLLYSGPRSEMPAEYEAKYKRVKAELDRYRKEMEDLLNEHW